MNPPFSGLCAPIYITSDRLLSFTAILEVKAQYVLYHMRVSFRLCFSIPL